VNITVSAYNRPEYLRQTLAALRACDGLDSCRVAVLIDPSDEAGKCADVATTLGFESFAYTHASWMQRRHPATPSSTDSRR
jgi:hypothetical protein